ncbi:MAG TPA: LysM peptidoglycan-binding domain-containing protein [Chloroflexota bacterium]|nr:LysM peptidoglycan-binding domain-containing protein [Chloroflexota bacterium]
MYDRFSIERPRITSARSRRPTQSDAEPSATGRLVAIILIVLVAGVGWLVALSQTRIAIPARTTAIASAPPLVESARRSPRTDAGSSTPRQVIASEGAAPVAAPITAGGASAEASAVAPSIAAPIAESPPASASTPGAQPERVSAPGAAPSSPPIAPVIVRHVVGRGEDVSSIARAYGIAAQDLVTANGLQSTGVVQPGQVVYVPMTPGVVHAVEPGQTLAEISQRFGVSVGVISATNGIDDPAKLQAGQVLLIPIHGPQASADEARPNFSADASSNSEGSSRRP